MNSSPNVCAGRKSWDPGNHLDIQTIETVFLALKQALVGVDELAIDLSRVDYIDSTGVQLLLALALDCRRRGTVIESVGISPAVNQAFQTLGLQVVNTLGGPQ